MNANEYFDLKLFRTNFRARDKRDALSQMARVIHKAGYCETEAEALSVLWSRELIGSTGLTGGLAVPGDIGTQMYRRSGIGILVAPDGVPFDTQDALPVRVFVLLALSKPVTGMWLKCFAIVSRCLRRRIFRSDLFASSTPEEVLRVICKYGDFELE
ncbi:MAG TPA: PTS sugar transporter subunit IIA [Candidatus Ozemobacteraceae bacterium]|nr:PTS sugar transporter subunit IIA [Candidatus Ozemobacteraceae bacterium]